MHHLPLPHPVQSLRIPNLAVGTCSLFPQGTGFTLTSSKGKCAVSNNVLTCASSVSTAATFTVSQHAFFLSSIRSSSNYLMLINHSGPARRWTSRIQRTHNLVRKQCAERGNSSLHLNHNPCYITDHSMGPFLIQESCMRQRGEATRSLILPADRLDAGRLDAECFGIDD